MNPQKLALYQKIQAFALDEPNVYFTYSQRLARAHRWSNDYSQRVIEEYKKFLFLAIAAGHPVTPSVAVDEAWHLHLTYTRSYWDELCGQVLGKPLHHHPTQGGQQQRQLFENYYAQTLESYQQFFGCPPDDIWPSSTRRFNPAEQIRQINQKDYWLIPKPSLMSVSQLFRSWSQNLWLKGIVTFLLMLGFVLSLSPAMAQVSSSSDQRSLFKILHQWLLDNPFVGFGIVVSGISFLIEFILSLLPLKPIFIQPVGKIRAIVATNNNHYLEDHSALAVSIFSLSAVFFSFLSSFFYFGPVVGFEGFLSLLYWPLLLGGIFSVVSFIEISLIKFLTRTQRRSLPPLSCIRCRKKLTMLTSLSNFVTHQEKIAMKIGSTTFEAWHCQNCYPEINRQSIRLITYRNTSNYFGRCSVCKEVTMTKNSSRIIEVATSKQEGKKLINYTCQCCHKEEETTEIIPRLQEVSGFTATCTGGSCTGGCTI
jgi:hypothetical protein